jgi:hypothetical protein
LTFLALFALLSPLAFAQNTASMVGVVSDASGGVIPGANVKVTRQETGTVSEVQSNPTGFYTVAALEPGIYSVEVSAEGFKTFRRSEVVLNVRDRARVDVTLDIGQVTEVIEVTERAVTLQTENATVEEVVSGRQVANIAMNGRNFMQLAALVPGANNNNNGGFNTPTGVSSGAAGSISFNGMRQNHNVWRVDGQENYDRGCGGCVEVLPSIDAIEEFKVSTANAEVDAGFGAGGQINLQIKSGTQEYHGAFYEFLRNDTFDANNFFRNLSGAKNPKLRYNNFGYNVGGPISFGGYNRDKTKTFFFWNHEWRRIRNERVINASAVAGPLRQGDFSGTGLTLNDPLSGNPFPNNQIPADRIDPNALILGDPSLVLPLPNQADGSYIDVGGEPIDVHQEILRVDHNLNDRNRVFFRFVMDSNSQTFATTQWGGMTYPTIGTQFTNNPKKFLGQWTSTISPNVVNELAVGFSRQPLSLDPIGNFQKPNGLSTVEMFAENRADRLPNMRFEGVLGVNVDGGSWPWTNVLDTWQFRNNTLWNRGNHTIRVGAEYMPFDKVQDFFGQTQGAYTFRRDSIVSHEYANFLLGRAAVYNELELQKSPNYQTRSGGIWVSDTWRASQDLTVTLALRYDMLPHGYVETDELSAFYPRLFDPSQAVEVTSNDRIVPDSGNLLNGIAVAGQNGIPRGVVDNHWKLFAPRFGIAWRPFGDDTVLRVGFGLFYERIQGNDVYNVGPNPPFSFTAQLFDTNLTNPGGGEQVRTVGNLRTYDGPYKIPQMKNWNIGVQHRFAGGVVGNVAYVGTAGTHLQISRNINQLTLDAAARVRAGELTRNQARPYVGWGDIHSYENATSSSYHGLQASLRTDNWKGLSLQGSYTWSKTLDFASGDNGTNQAQNMYDLRPERGHSDFHRPHVLVLSYVYEIPTLGESAVAKHVLGGWTVSGITTLQSGAFMTATVPGDPHSVSTCACRPNLVGNPNIGSDDRLEFFDPAAFTGVTAGQYGTAGRNIIQRAGANNWDLSLFKDFRFGERARLQFRAEWFNFFNHTQWTAFETNSSNNRFGQATGARDARTTQFGLKFYW